MSGLSKHAIKYGLCWESDHTHRSFNLYDPYGDAKHIATINNLSPEKLRGRDPDNALLLAKLLAAAPLMQDVLKDVLHALKQEKSEYYLELIKRVEEAIMRSGFSS